MPENDGKVASKKRGTAKSVRRDETLLQATDIARNAAVELSRPSSVGEHLGSKMLADRLAVHRFACEDKGYLGWAWEISVARAPRSKNVTVCEVGLVPDEEAVLAPEWIPWEDRLQPGDVSRDDVLPFDANDHRLVSGFEQTDEEIADIRDSREAGLGRARVLSQAGIDEAATRWYESERGPSRQKRNQASCSTCGFLLKMNGSLGQVFGVCANAWSPDDGRVVSLEHSCGAHSETDTARHKPQWPIVDPKMDDYQIEIASF